MSQGPKTVSFVPLQVPQQERMKTLCLSWAQPHTDLKDKLNQGLAILQILDNNAVSLSGYNDH